MVGDPFGLYFVGECLQFSEVVEIQWIGTADRQGHAVHDHRVMFTYPVQIVAGFATGNHVVFGQYLEPVNRRFVLQDVFKMRDAQSQSKSKGRVGHCVQYNAWNRTRVVPGALLCFSQMVVKWT